MTLLSLDEAAQRRGCCRKSLLAWCRAGVVLNAHKVGHFWVIDGDFKIFRTKLHRQIYEFIALGVTTSIDMREQFGDKMKPLRSLIHDRHVVLLGRTAAGYSIVVTQDMLSAMTRREMEDAIDAVRERYRVVKKPRKEKPVVVPKRLAKPSAGVAFEDTIGSGPRVEMAKPPSFAEMLLGGRQV